MYDNNQIQDMIERCRANKVLCKSVLDQISDYSDWRAIQHVISEGWYETFDRYDSDVCEQFITAYENATRR